MSGYNEYLSRNMSHFAPQNKWLVSNMTFLYFECLVTMNSTMCRKFPIVVFIYRVVGLLIWSGNSNFIQFRYLGMQIFTICPSRFLFWVSWAFSSKVTWDKLATKYANLFGMCLVATAMLSDYAKNPLVLYFSYAKNVRLHAFEWCRHENS